MVFKGDGVIKDFPGNYTQYREWQALLPKEAGELKVDKDTKPTKTVRERVKMTFKEKREFEQLEKDITLLEDEKKRIEDALSTGMLSVDQITEMSKRLPVLNDELDEKSMRWLELSELA